MVKTSNDTQEKKGPDVIEDGGVYLLVASECSEFDAALRRAAALAIKNKGHVGVLFVIEEQGFLHWGDIQKKIEHDQRAEAEKRLWELSLRLNELNGQYLGFYIAAGKIRDVIVKTLNSDDNIRALVLGAGTSSSNPLVSYFTSKGLSHLKVPLVVVPEGL